jgi:hypothetical protein
VIFRGDEDLLALKHVASIPVLSPAELLARIETEESQDSQE